MKFTASKELITPEWARNELAEQEQRITKGVYRQRALNADAVVKYARDMRNGYWRANNQGIGFDTEGNLLDGRHRLWAVVRAGVPVEMLVIRGLEADSRNNGSTVHIQDTVDCGRTRNVAMQLGLDGVKNAFLVSAAIRSIAIICTSQHNRIGIVPTRHILAMVSRDIETIYELLHHSPRNMTGFFVGPVVMYRKAFRDKADDFVTKFYTQAKLNWDHPAMALRRYLENHSVTGRDGQFDAVKAVCLSLMHFHKGSGVNALRQHTPYGMEWLVQSTPKLVKNVRNLFAADLQPISVKDLEQK